MRHDGKNEESELRKIEHFFSDNFGRRTAKLYLDTLKVCLKRKINIDEVCSVIPDLMEYKYRLHVYHFLYKIARADGIIDLKEEELIEKIAIKIGINKRGRKSIRGMFTNYFQSYIDEQNRIREERKKTFKKYVVDPLQKYYDILEIEKGADQEDIKNAYKRLVKLHHPDKVAHLGVSHMKIAREKFLKIQEAYEKLSKK